MATKEVKFWAKCTELIIFADIREGKSVPVPDNKFIRFKKVGIGRCTFNTSDPKEIEWLKRHSEFNKKIFIS